MSQCLLQKIVLPLLLGSTLFPNITGNLALANTQNQTPSKGEPNKSPAPSKTESPAETLELRNKKFQALESFSRVLNHLETMYVDEKAVSSEALVERALKGMVASLDPHTSYLPAQQLRELTNDTSGKFGGIGVVLTQQNGRLEIIEVVPDTPAAKAKLQAGDTILSVDGVTITKNNIEEVLNKLRGLPGSSVRLSLRRKSPPAKLCAQNHGRCKSCAKSSRARALHTTTCSVDTRTSGLVYFRKTQAIRLIKFSASTKPKTKENCRG
jgi:C-terminal processing protease CtpA/Prc